MTATIDRERLAALKAREDADFVARHPRSRELFERAQAHMLDGVPMNWMTRWSSPFPPYVARGARRPLHLRRRARVRRLLPRRHRRHDRPLARRARSRPSPRRPARGITTMLPTEDSLWVAGELAAPLRPAVLAARAHGDRRQPLRRAPRAARHRAAEDPRLQLLLPRLGRRDDHHHQRRRRRAPSRATSGRRSTRPSRPRSSSGTTSRRSSGRSRPATWPASSPSRR